MIMLKPLLLLLLVLVLALIVLPTAKAEPCASLNTCYECTLNSFCQYCFANGSGTCIGINGSIACPATVITLSENCPCNDSGRASCSRCLVGDNPQGCLWCAPTGGGGSCIDNTESDSLCPNSTVNSLAKCDDAHHKKGNLALWLWILIGCVVGVIVLMSMCIVVICICCASIFGIRYGESRALRRGSRSAASDGVENNSNNIANVNSSGYQRIAESPEQQDDASRSA